MQRLRNLGLVVLISTLASVAGGCSHSKPTEGDGEQVAKKIIAANCKGDCVELTDFEKTNGIMGKDSGIKVYILEYTCTVKTKANCFTSLGFPPSKELQPIETLHASPDKDSFQTVTKPGTEMKFKGDLKFIQTEKGWRCEEDKDELF